MDSDGPNTFFVLAILATVASTVLLRPQASLAEPGAYECRTKPGSAAPPGTRWYYRVNPTDNRRCWFLHHEGVKARSHARDASPGPTRRHENATEAARASPVQVMETAPAQPPQGAPTHWASAEPASTEPSVHAMPIDFFARWHDFPKSLDFDGRALATTSSTYAEEQVDALEQTPLILPGMASFRPMFPVAALAITLLLAGAIFELVRRRPAYRGHHWRAAGERRPRQQMRANFAATAGRRSAGGTRQDGAGSQSPMPTDPAHDLKVSLQELIGDLQRAGAASGPPRSFAPPARLGGKSRRVVAHRGALQSGTKFELHFAGEV